jgi:hypothetical protein
MPKITVEVTLTDEDLRAGRYELMHGHCGEDEKMTPEDYRDWILSRIIGAGMARKRDRMNWGKNRYGDHPNLRLEEREVYRGGVRVALELPVRVTDPRRGSQSCPTSPDGTCWYDEREDPCWDFCVFCGGPHERK